MEKGPSTFAQYWTSEYSLMRHFDEHGAEFGHTDDDQIEEYLNAARKFINNVNLTNIIRFRAANGSIYKFNKKTLEFAIVSKTGRIVTYFHLEGGERKFWQLLVDENGVEI